MSSNPLPPASNSTPLVQTIELVNQTSHGPILREVATQLLRQALDEAYPELDIDPAKTKLATPRWLIVEDRVEAGPTHFESLTGVLMRLGLYDIKANFLEGEHFLTCEPDARHPVHLNVSIEQIARILNKLAARLFVEMQVRQLDFWNAKGNKIVRWQEFSDTLRNMMDVQKVKGWDAIECEMAREVFRDPDPGTRKNLNSEFSAIQACLIDIDLEGASANDHLLIAGGIVLKATYRNRQLLVMYSIQRAYESFSSMEALGNSLPGRLADLADERTLKWRLYEPEGNVFDHLTWALVSSQLDTINALRFLEPPAEEPVEPDAGLNAKEGTRFLQLDAAVPPWLRNASANDIQDYGHYVSSLGLLYRQPASELARAEMPSINSYALRQMCDAILADPLALDAANLPLEDLRIKITNSMTAGNFILPNPLDQHVETLADFALENAAPYQASVFFKGGETVPPWLTVDFLTNLSAQVDIGKNYPALIKPKLMGDPVTSRRQEDFYCNQLRWLLPLQALEARFRPETGVDERGYHIIRDLVNPTNAPYPIALYPLTLTPQHRLFATSDTVDNMFIISPRNNHHAPCLLYRPMFDEPLLQYPSRQNLLYALHQPGALRDSVLAWLPDKALSYEYAEYVFPTGLPSPWLIAQQLLNPFQRTATFGRVTIESVEITGNLSSALFKSNARALVDLADRQSQSNAEQRWNVLKESGWALFDVATNFLSGAVGTAVWVWQAINQIQQALDAHERGDSFIEWTSVSDVLLALGIILSHHAVLRRQKASSRSPIERPSREHAPGERVEPMVIKRNPVALAADLPSSHLNSLDLDGSTVRRTPTALGAYLDTLKVAAPDISSTSVTKLQAAPPHFYQHANLRYAQVGDRWFQVELRGDDEVYIQYPSEPGRTGPRLIDNGRGQWVLDLRLRLRGGAGNAISRHQEAADEQRRNNLESALQTFKLLENAREAQLRQLHDDVQQAVSTEYDAKTAAYLQQLDSTIDEYRQALQQLGEWRTLGGTQNYQQDLLRMSVSLQRNLSLWFVIKLSEYGKSISSFTKSVQAEAIPRHIYVENVQKASTVGQEMVERLTLSNSTLEGMRAAGKFGIESAIKIRKLTPTFTELDLKANEIGMSQELCLNEQASPLMEEARVAVGKVVVSAGKAAIVMAELMKIRGVPADPHPHIEKLNALTETFADADQRMKELPTTYPDLVKQPKLNELRSLIHEFAQLAQSRLEDLLPEPEPFAPPTSADRMQPGPSRQPIKVRKTRPREPTKNEPEKTPAEPLKSFEPAIYQHPVPNLNDEETIEAGIELNLDIGKFIERTRKDALLPRRIPADIQDVFDLQALKLEQAADNVDQALINIKAAQGKDLPIGSLSTELRDGATRLRREGVRVRADLYTRRKPTQSILTWMHDNGQIEISRDPRGRIQTKGLGDCFQEYRITYKARKEPLWVAHFHYETLKSPATAPTAAHLKISETYLKTLSQDLQKVLGTFEPIDGVFRKISEPALRKLFLDLEAPSQTAT